MGIIESFGWTKPFSNEDLGGVGFLTSLRKGKEIPL